jgi:hypothetical protein
MEQYANYGFYKIEEKLQYNSNFFFKNTGFLNLILDMVKDNSIENIDIIEDL